MTDKSNYGDFATIKKARADERAKVLAEVRGWLDELWNRYFPDEYTLNKVTNNAPADHKIMGIMETLERLRAKLAEMKV